MGYRFLLLLLFTIVVSSLTSMPGHAQDVSLQKHARVSTEGADLERPLDIAEEPSLPSWLEDLLARPLPVEDSEKQTEAATLDDSGPELESKTDRPDNVDPLFPSLHPFLLFILHPLWKAKASGRRTKCPKRRMAGPLYTRQSIALA